MGMDFKIKSIATLFREFPDFLPVFGIAADYLITVIFAGNLYIITLDEANQSVVFMAKYNSIPLFAAYVAFDIFVNILVFTYLWKFAECENLKREYYFLAITMFTLHIAAGLTWPLAPDWFLSAWDSYLYSDIAGTIAVIFIIYILAVGCIQKVERYKKEYL